MIRTVTFAATLFLAGPALAAPDKAAVFDVQFSNLSPVPSDAADADRGIRFLGENNMGVGKGNAPKTGAGESIAPK